MFVEGLKIQQKIGKNNLPYVYVGSLLLCLLLTQTGCVTPQPTAAQNQYNAAANNIKWSQQKAESCMASVRASPENAPLALHTPDNLLNATVEQLTDKSKPTKEEIASLRAIFPKKKACWNAFVEDLAASAPTQASIQRQAYNKTEAIMLDLIERKISWGDYLRRQKEIATEADGLLTRDWQGATGNYEQAHNQEMAQRQARATAAMQFLQNQQIINQNQEAINSANRAASAPVNTVCQNYGGTVRCTTY